MSYQKQDGRGQAYGSHRGSFWSTEFQLESREIKIIIIIRFQLEITEIKIIITCFQLESTGIRLPSATGPMHGMTVKMSSVKTNRKSVLHELEICGFNLISVPKSEPLWLQYMRAHPAFGMTMTNTLRSVFSWHALHYSWLQTLFVNVKRMEWLECRSLPPASAVEVIDSEPSFRLCVCLLVCSKGYHMPECQWPIMWWCVPSQYDVMMSHYYVKWHQITNFGLKYHGKQIMLK